MNGTAETQSDIEKCNAIEFDGTFNVGFELLSNRFFQFFLLFLMWNKEKKNIVFLFLNKNHSQLFQSMARACFFFAIELNCFEHRVLAHPMVVSAVKR